MDTQIGTRPQIGALEIHQAYILASLNWLQQTRSLEMNHVAIEKAEKAKLLGFDHSSVITDAEKYMNNLETFKCYNFFSQNFLPLTSVQSTSTMVFLPPSSWGTSSVGRYFISCICSSSLSGRSAFRRLISLLG